MSDERWRDCVGTWDRLKWARKQKFGTAQDAAVAVGENVNTYRAYERDPDSSKSLKLDHQKAAHFAKRFGVSWQWLLKGEGEPFVSRHTEVQELAADLDQLPEDRRKEMVAAFRSMIRAAGAA